MAEHLFNSISLGGRGGTNVKKTNPGISFTEVGRVLGERWNKMKAEEKAPYEAKARADKKRYNDEISGYKKPQASNANDSDSS